ncbi:hypothetical protein MferCBS31731_002496 [Microsporum ferrugineum]
MSNSESRIETFVANDSTPLLSATPDEEEADRIIYDGLRRVSDSFPLSVWLIATIELCERFAYFGILGPLQNYIQNSGNDPLQPGGIGLGQAYATTINQMFMLWCFITPIMGAIVAEQNFGRVRTIVYSSAIYSCGLATLFLSSLPVARDIGVPFLGLSVSLFLIGIGTGGIKTNVSSLIAEQYTGPQERILVLGSGEKVVIDRDLTLQRIFTMFFLYINVGSLASLASTTIEQKYGFSVAFALPTIVFLIGLIILLTGKDQYVSHAPDNSLITKACRVIWIAVKNKCSLEHARLTHQAEEGSTEMPPWDDLFIDDLGCALSACKVFLLYPFYWAAYSQLLTNFISQAATMETHGIPNDVMTGIDPLVTLILLPILDRFIFPLLRSLGASVRHIDRMALGFLFCGISMLYAAFIQRSIYAAPPCYDHPRSKDCMGGKFPNQVSVFLQIPAYVLVALSEILASVAGIEYAYTKAPKSMKSLVMAVYLSTVSAGALVAMTVSPLTVDPRLTWMYVTLGIETLVAGAVLWVAAMRMWFEKRKR